MNGMFVPKINCRFKVRQDIDSFVGFFHGKGVLIFNEIGAFIVKQMTGEKSLREIEQLVKNTFPTIEDPMDEILSIAQQLKEAGFF